jgi:hypothetical protein
MHIVLIGELALLVLSLPKYLMFDFFNINFDQSSYLKCENLNIYLKYIMYTTRIWLIYNG